MSRNPSGRPKAGPKVELRLPAEILARVDADANRQRITRTKWLREAVTRTLPYDALTHLGRCALDGALTEIDGLGDLRDWALDPEAPRDERLLAAERYSSTLYEMRAMLSEMRDNLPIQEAREAYAKADSVDPEMTQQATAKAWARARAADMLDHLLDAVALALPVNEGSVEKRAGLDDPLMDLDLDG